MWAYYKAHYQVIFYGLNPNLKSAHFCATPTLRSMQTQVKMNCYVNKMPVHNACLTQWQLSNGKSLSFNRSLTTCQSRWWKAVYIALLVLHISPCGFYSSQSLFWHWYVLLCDAAKAKQTQRKLGRKRTQRSMTRKRCVVFYSKYLIVLIQTLHGFIGAFIDPILSIFCVQSV